MKIIMLLLSLICLASLTFAQKEKADIRKGNYLYQQQKYKEAEESYRNAVQKSDQNLPGNFNLGDAQYKQKNFKDAQLQFSKIAASANNKNVVAQAYHNLGNSFVESKKLEEGIDAYKKALINNPKDDQTRYNLAYAQKKLQDKKNQDKKDKQNKDKNQDKNKQDQNKNSNNDKDQQNKNSKDQNKDQQDKKDQDKAGNDKKDQENGGQPKMSKEDAERMLEALNNQEKQTQDKLKNNKLKGGKVVISKDW
jgi:Ca-activated chloride channel family protein